MTDIEQFIYIIKEIIWRIQLKYNFGAERIIYLTYGVINMYINIKIQKYGNKQKSCIFKHQLYRKYVDGKIKNKEEFLKNLKEMEGKRND